MLDLVLIAALGFLGSFGHCLGMCSPITVALSLSQQSETANRWQQFRFHLLLNLGRLVSYALVGASIGALGSVLVANGQMAGLSSGLRQGMAGLTGLLLIWFGLSQISPQLLPRVPLLNPMAQAGLHARLNHAMQRLSLKPQRWTPLLLGLIWGLIPCGFLYAAQLKAAETMNLWLGGATLLAFGLGTWPTMLAVVSAEGRRQLFRLGGWITLIIGGLTLFRTGEMVDLTGHASLLCLLLALIARPLSRFWSPLLQYRRALGVGAFGLALIHVAHMLTMGWNLSALPFLLPSLQIGGWAGMMALGLMLPLALTSFDRAQRRLGRQWRQLHLLSVPVLVLAVVHAVLLGSNYLGGFAASTVNWLATIALGSTALLALLVRWQQAWTWLSLEPWYVPPKK
jgi:hypothetical protein